MDLLWLERTGRGPSIVETWIWIVVAAVAVLAVLALLLSYRRGQRRRVLKERAATATPVVPTKELIDLALKQREAALAEQRRKMDAAASAVAMPPPPTLPYVIPSRGPIRASSAPEPVLEVESTAAEPPVNPVQKLALEQWEDVEIVSRKSPKDAGEPRRARPAVEEFHIRPAASKPPIASPREPDVVREPRREMPKPKKAEPFETDWGNVEVRRDVKQR